MSAGSSSILTQKQQRKTNVQAGLASSVGAVNDIPDQESNEHDDEFLRVAQDATDTINKAQRTPKQSKPARQKTSRVKDYIQNKLANRYKRKKKKQVPDPNLYATALREALKVAIEDDLWKSIIPLEMNDILNNTSAWKKQEQNLLIVKYKKARSHYECVKCMEHDIDKIRGGFVTCQGTYVFTYL